MIFDPGSGALYGNDGVLLKHIHCPLGLKISDLRKLPDDSPDRYCSCCRKKILCADNMTDDDLLSAVVDGRSSSNRQEFNIVEPIANNNTPDASTNLCIFVTPQAKHVVVLRNEKLSGWGYVEPNRENLLVIQTARSIEAMKEVSKKGLRPLIYATGTCSKIGGKLRIFQHIKTGEVWSSGDFRNSEPTSDEVQERMEKLVDDPITPEEFKKWVASIKNDWIEVAPWFNYRPDESFPYAAYLVPPDLSIGQRVYLNDVIEEIPITIWNQGDTERLKSCYAVWTGGSFELEIPEVDLGWIG